jgi:membrane associated rhomboid family serine protease
LNPPLPPITKAVMLICLGFYCLGVIEPSIAHTLALWSYGSPQFGFWQLLTHPLEHETTTHLFFNLLGIYLLGVEVEAYLGARRYLMVLVASTLTAGLTVLLLTSATGQYARASGISGGLFGLMLVYGMAFGERVIMPIIPPVPMKAKTWVAAFGAVELMLGFSGASGPAHLAHLGGMLGAYVLMVVWRRGRS